MNKNSEEIAGKSNLRFKKNLINDLNLSFKLSQKIKNFRINLLIFIGFIISSLVGFFFLPPANVSYLPAFMFTGRSFNRFDVTLLWMFFAGFVCSLNSIAYFLFMGNAFKSNTKIKKAKKFSVGIFLGIWLAMFYTQWDCVYFAKTGMQIAGSHLWASLCIFCSTVFVYILTADKYKK